jgi:hypothetical protein
MNRKKRGSLLVWTSVASVALAMGLAQIASCGGPTFIIQQYAGAPRPKESIAVIRLRGADSVQVLALDRERLMPVERGVRLHIEVAPGMHEIDVGSEGEIPTSGVDEFRQRLRFTAEAGKVYRVIVSQRLATGAAGQYAPRIYEVDPESESPIRVVSSVVEANERAGRPRADAAVPPQPDAGSDAPAFVAADAASTRD